MMQLWMRLAMQTKIYELMEENKNIRERLNQCLEKYLHLAGWKITWDLINELVENELQIEKFSNQ